MKLFSSKRDDLSSIRSHLFQTVHFRRGAQSLIFRISLGIMFHLALNHLMMFSWHN
jgi:hypothetical protein